MTMRRLTIALSLTVFSTTAALAQTGVQITRDAKRSIISKDIGNQRWAIVYSYDDKSVVGNVFNQGGGDPQFVWCQSMGENGQNANFACYGADKCPQAPCPPSVWTFISNVNLPLAFFYPPGGGAPGPTPTPTAPGGVCGAPLTSIPMLCNLQVSPNPVSRFGSVTVSFGIQDSNGDIDKFCLGLALQGIPAIDCTFVTPRGAPYNERIQTNPISLAGAPAGLYTLAFNVGDTQGHVSNTVSTTFLVQ